MGNNVDIDRNSNSALRQYNNLYVYGGTTVAVGRAVGRSTVV